MDFVKDLKMSKDQAQLCYIASIKTIEELANCDPERFMKYCVIAQKKQKN